MICRKGVQGLDFATFLPRTVRAKRNPPTMIVSTGSNETKPDKIGKTIFQNMAKSSAIFFASLEFTSSETSL
jgi:hypothetical protein